MKRAMTIHYHRGILILCLLLQYLIVVAQQSTILDVKDRIIPINLQALYSPCPPTKVWVEVYKDDFSDGALDKWFWKPSLLDEEGIHHMKTSPDTKEYNSESSLQFLAQNNGTLRIKSTYDPNPPFQLGDETLLPNEHFDDSLSNLRQWHYQSGAIRSRYTFGQGIISIKCQIPSGAQMWPAFWMTGECADEIDIFEFQNKQSDNHHDKRTSLSVHTKLDCINDPNQNRDTDNYNFSQSMATSLHEHNVVWNDFAIIFHTDSWTTRQFYHYYKRRQLPFGITVLTPVRNCQDIEANSNYVEDPQFSDVMMSIVINSAIRNAATANTFPKNFDIDFFKIYDDMDCQETRTLTSNADLVGSFWNTANGDRTISAKQINITPSTQISLNHPKVLNPLLDYLPGDFLILTAGEEIRILPGFEVTHNANLIGQIRSCSPNKTDALLQPDSLVTPHDLIILGDSMYEATNFDGFSSESVPGIDWMLYPNPADKEFTVSGLKGGERVCVYDGLGHLKYETKQKPATTSLLIPVRDWPSGVYTVSILRDNSRLFSDKLLIYHP